MATLSTIPYIIGKDTDSKTTSNHFYNLTTDSHSFLRTPSSPPLTSPTKILAETATLETLFTHSFISSHRSLVRSVLQSTTIGKLRAKQFSKNLAAAPLLAECLRTAWNKGWELGRTHAIAELKTLRPPTPPTKAKAIPYIIGKDEASSYFTLDGAKLSLFARRKAENDPRVTDIDAQINALTDALTNTASNRASAIPGSDEANRLDDQINDIRSRLFYVRQDRTQTLKEVQAEIRTEAAATKAAKLAKAAQTPSPNADAPSREEINPATPEESPSSIESANNSSTSSSRFDSAATTQKRKKQEALQKRIAAAEPTADMSPRQKAIASTKQAKLIQDLANLKIQDSVDLSNTNFSSIYLDQRIEQISSLRSADINAQMKAAIGQFLSKDDGTIKNEKQLIDALTGDKEANSRVNYINQLLAKEGVTSKKQSSKASLNPEETNNLVANNLNAQDDLKRDVIFPLIGAEVLEDETRPITLTIPPEQLGNIEPLENRLVATGKVGEITTLKSRIAALRRASRNRTLTTAENIELTAKLTRLAAAELELRTAQADLKKLKRALPGLRAGRGVAERNLNQLITLSDADKQALALSQDTVSVSALDQYRTDLLRYGNAQRTILNPIKRIAATEINLAYNMGRLQAFSQAGVKCVRWRNDTEKTACPFCVDRADATSDTPLRLDLVLNQGGIYSEFVIPAHPNCRCYWEPATCTNDSDREPRRPKKSIVGRFVLGGAVALGALGVLGAYTALYRSRSLVGQSLQESIAARQRRVDLNIPLPSLGPAIPDLRDLSEAVLEPLDLPIEMRAGADAGVAQQIRQSFIEGAENLLANTSINRDQSYLDALVASNTEVAAALRYTRNAADNLQELGGKYPNSYDRLSTKVLDLIARANEGAQDISGDFTDTINELTDLANLSNNATYIATRARQEGISALSKAAYLTTQAKTNIATRGFMGLGASDEFVTATRQYRDLESRTITDLSSQVPAIGNLETRALDLNDRIGNLSQYDENYVGTIRDYHQSIIDLNYELRARVTAAPDVIPPFISFVQTREDTIRGLTAEMKSARIITSPRYLKLVQYRQELQQLQDQLAGVTTLRKQLYTAMYKKISEITAYGEQLKSLYSFDPNNLYNEVPILTSYLTDSEQITDLVNLRNNELKPFRDFYNEIDGLQNQASSLLDGLEAKPRLTTVDRVFQDTGELVSKESYLTSLIDELKQLRAIPKGNRTFEEQQRIDAIELEQIQSTRAEFKRYYNKNQVILLGQYGAGKTALS